MLNEVVIDRGASPYLCQLDLYIQGRLVTLVQGDGRFNNLLSSLSFWFSSCSGIHFHVRWAKTS